MFCYTRMLQMNPPQVRLPSFKLVMFWKTTPPPKKKWIPRSILLLIINTRRGSSWVKIGSRDIYMHTVVSILNSWKRQPAWTTAMDTLRNLRVRKARLLVDW